MKKHQGFTLVEIAVVIAVIGIIASIAIPQYGAYLKKAKITQAVMITKEAMDALVTYHTVNRQFVPNYGDLSRRNREVGLQNHSQYASDDVRLMWVGSRGVRGKDSTSAHVAVLLPPDMGFQDEGQSRAHMLSTIEFRDGRYILQCNDKDAVWPSTIKSELLHGECDN